MATSNAPHASADYATWISTISEETQWEVIIPASFFAASAVCLADPSLAPAIVFLLLGLATIFVSPVMMYFTKPATAGMTETLTGALNTITDEEHSEQRDRLFSAVAGLISKSVESAALKETLKKSVLSCLLDDDLHDATLNTLQNALVKAAGNEGLRLAALDVVKQAFTGALNDEIFVRELMASIVGAIVTASKQEELTDSVLEVVTEAVSQALENEKFVAELRGAIKDTLADGDIYKAGARGMVSAAFGNAMGLSKSLGQGS